MIDKDKNEICDARIPSIKIEQHDKWLKQKREKKKRFLLDKFRLSNYLSTRRTGRKRKKTRI